MSAGTLWRSLLGPGMQRDGQADGVEQIALAAGERLGQGAHTPRPDPSLPVVAAVAEKVLQGWLQNRYQTRYPLVLKLNNMEPAHASLITGFAADCLRLGDTAGDAHEAAREWLRSIGAPQDALDALAEPAHDPAVLVAQIRQADLAAEAYAVAAHVLGRRALVNRRFLDYLSARLELPDDVARSINRRHAS